MLHRVPFIAFMLILPALQLEGAAAQEPRRLSVDQDDPELQQFRAAPRQPRTAARSAVLKELENVDIPVLDFDQPPLGSVKGRARAASACKQETITDNDRGWYAVRHDCGSVIITVSGDQRVPSAEQSPAPKRLERAAASRVRITPASGNLKESGGLTAEIVMSRYPNIPYVITVECQASTQKEARQTVCTSRSGLQAIADSLRLVAVPPR